MNVVERSSVTLNIAFEYMVHIKSIYVQRVFYFTRSTSVLVLRLCTSQPYGMSSASLSCRGFGLTGLYFLNKRHTEPGSIKKKKMHMEKSDLLARSIIDIDHHSKIL